MQHVLCVELAGYAVIILQPYILPFVSLLVSVSLKPTCGCSCGCAGGCGCGAGSASATSVLLFRWFALLCSLPIDTGKKAFSLFISAAITTTRAHACRSVI